MDIEVNVPTRERLLHALYEAAELEHNLMCTYLYAAFSLRSGADEGLSPREAQAVARWRQAIVHVAVDEMGHLTAVWNITAALGGTPRFGRGNFPLDPGGLPASVVVKLAAFNEQVLQHFIYLERPEGSAEADSAEFTPEFAFKRGVRMARLMPMGVDYDTVGTFYQRLSDDLRQFVALHGEAATFCGDPALQLSGAEVTLAGAKPVICAKTALAAFTAIVEQGEGAPVVSAGSHYQTFLSIRTEMAELKRDNPDFTPAFPAATNPVQRTPMRPSGRVWIENEAAATTVDLANTAYGLMLRLIAYTYVVPRPALEKALALDLALGLMRAVTSLGERAARLPAGPSNPACNAGMSFAALRDAAPLPRGPAARRFFVERLGELAAAAAAIDAAGDQRLVSATRTLVELAARATREFQALPATDHLAAVTSPPGPPASQAPPIPVPGAGPGVEEIEGKAMTLIYEGRRCIHSRYCVTWAPNVFLANVVGPWIHPDNMDVDRLVEIAHACPSGAIRYRRKDGAADEPAPLVNLIAVREGGPYAVRAQISLTGEPAQFRATRPDPFVPEHHGCRRFPAE